MLEETEVSNLNHYNCLFNYDGLVYETNLLIEVIYTFSFSYYQFVFVRAIIYNINCHIPN